MRPFFISGWAAAGPQRPVLA